MQESDPNKPVEPNNRLGRISKNAAFLMMMAVMLLFLMRAMGSPDQAVLELTYTEFNDHLNADRVDQVTFRDRAVSAPRAGPRIPDQFNSEHDAKEPPHRPLSQSATHAGECGGSIRRP